MNQHDFGAVAPHDGVSEERPDSSRDQVPTAPTPSPDVAPASRHLYTLTVDQVAADLYTYQIYRDERTIQRWCKGGKLRAIIDHANGDRYLIDPASVRDMVATILAERNSAPPTAQPTPRPRFDTVAPERPTADTRPAPPPFTAQPQADSRPDAPTPEPTAAATSSESRDEVAALKRRVAELERETVMLSADKQVREQMVDYLKEQFGEMLEEALNRSQEVGMLQAENRHLRAMLPPAPRGQGTPDWRGAEDVYRTAEEVQPVEPERVEEPPRTQPFSMHRREPWRPG